MSNSAYPLCGTHPRSTHPLVDPRNDLLPEDGIVRATVLAESDLNALRAVEDWIKAFVSMPHKDLGRTGPVCPFVPGALDRKTLWLASERISDRSSLDVVKLSGATRTGFGTLNRSTATA